MLLIKTDMRHWASEDRGGEEGLGLQADHRGGVPGANWQRFPWGVGGLCKLRKDGTLEQVRVGGRPASDKIGRCDKLLGPNWGDDFSGVKAEPEWAPKSTPRQEVVGKGHHARGLQQRKYALCSIPLHPE